MTEPKQMTPHQILSAARLLVYQRAPYFRAGVAHLVPRETPGLGTFASTKNWIMLWDPAVVADYGVEGTAAVVVHELWHLIRDHHARFEAIPMVNLDLANIAGDLSINPGVEQMGFTFPKGKHEGLYPKKFNLPDNLTTEEYYARLLKMDVKYVYIDGDDPGTKYPGMSVHVQGCGSCSGRPRKDEPAEDDAEGRSEAESQRVRVTIAKAVKQGAGRGTLPSELSRWADEVLKPPKIRWQDKLRRIGRAAVAYRPGSGHATYSKPSRRQAGIGFGPGKPSIPSYRATVPRVTLLVDTSGSMSDSALTCIMSEAQGIFQAAGATLDVVVCDAAVHGSKKVRSIKEACAMLKGGGGSDFNPAFEEIARRRPKTDLVVAATDGDISVPEKCPPGLQVIWLLTVGYSGSHHAPAKWGTSIAIDE